jgi:glycylpeptide N-tetradecanoyltransferase
VHPVFSEGEVAHYFIPRENVIESFVIEDDSGTITDFISFYSLPSTCLKNPNYTHVNVAYTYYNVPNKYDLNTLFVDSLVLARDKGYDVMNCLDIMNYGS